MHCTLLESVLHTSQLHPVVGGRQDGSALAFLLVSTMLHSLIRSPLGNGGQNLRVIQAPASSFPLTLPFVAVIYVGIIIHTKLYIYPGSEAAIRGPKAQAYLQLSK